MWSMLGLMGASAVAGERPQMLPMTSSLGCGPRPARQLSWIRRQRQVVVIRRFWPGSEGRASIRPFEPPSRASEHQGRAAVAAIRDSSEHDGGGSIRYVLEIRHGLDRHVGGRVIPLR